jgi:peptidylamidoglycolate lyase
LAKVILISGGDLTTKDTEIEITKDTKPLFIILPVIVMGQKISLLLILPVCFIMACKQKHAGQISKASYQLVKNWPSLPDTMVLGNPSGIGVDSNQNLIVFRRGNRDWPLIGSMPKTPIAQKTVLVLDHQTGKIINSWGDHLFIMPHGLTVDSANNVWVTDVGLHQVFKFTHDGKLLMKLGVAGVPGNDAGHFDQPTDVAIAADGSFYVSDGYGNSRVVKFSSEGKYLLEWGKKGNGPSEFNVPHGLTLDKAGNVYVADRANKRVEVFNPQGKFLKQLGDESFGRICGLTFDKVKNQIIAVDDETSWFDIRHNGSDIIVFDITGKVISRQGRTSHYSGPKCWYHDVAVDSDGNIYTADILNNMIQKFSPDPSK